MKENRITDHIREWERSSDSPITGVSNIPGDFSGVGKFKNKRFYVVNGNIVGVVGGSIEDFTQESVNLYEAPHPSLPLLFAMVEKDGSNIRGTYATTSNSIEEIDETLSSGGFAGYYELSEEVLSGDYYGVYYGSNTFYVGFTDNDELITGDEAYETAVDEVGLYDVVETDISVIVPPEEPDEDTVTEEEPSDHNESKSEIEDSETESSTDNLPVESRDDTEEDSSKSVEKDNAVDTNQKNISETSLESNETRPTTESVKNINERLDKIVDHIETLAAKQESLETRIGNLEQPNVESNSETDTDWDEITPEKALEQTDIFIRYHSRGQPMLNDVDDGEDADTITSNIQFETHTTFDPAKTKPAGSDSYNEFLIDRIEYKFSKWLIETLPYELRDTDGSEELARIYEAIPEIDHIEFNSTVALNTQETGDDDETDSVQFDLVFRDRKGNPLFVIQAEDSREQTSSNEIAKLVEKASRVSRQYDSLVMAGHVTSSFFGSGALERANDSINNGLLSRSTSYVKLNRKTGYHLCLFEGRHSSFHMSMPEL